MVAAVWARSCRMLSMHFFSSSTRSDASSTARLWRFDVSVRGKRRSHDDDDNHNNNHSDNHNESRD